MEYEQIKQLMEDMGNSKLSSLDIEFPNGIKIKMEKNDGKQVVVTQDSTSTNHADKVQTENAIEETNDAEKSKEEGFIVKSPMVGTFYMKSSPSSDPYVEVGSEVKKGDILCIIEAMKLMNEIESEYEGKITEVYAKDGEAIEYGKPLFRIV